MANVVLKIQTNEGTNESLTGFNADQIVNNVSSPLGTATTDNNGVAGLSFAKGFLKFKDGYLVNADGIPGVAQIRQSYNGFMFGATDNNGNYELTLTLSGNNLDKIVITGDKNANQFPTVAILDKEKTIYSNDYIWAIQFENPNTTHTIKFTTWNRPNYNACFTTLKVMLEYLELNKAWIDNLQSEAQTTPDATTINYGVLANTGSASIRDLNGEIKDYISDGILPNSNVPIQLYVNGNLVQTHITTDSDYTTDNMFTIQMTNDLASWDTIPYNGRTLTKQESLYSLLGNVLETVGYFNSSIDSFTKYFYPEAFDITPKSIECNCFGGWEIIGKKLKVEPNKTYKLKLKYNFENNYLTYGDYNGVRLQVIENSPTDSESTRFEIAGEYLGVSNGTKEVYLEFTPNVENVYIIFNFGYASDGQIVKLNIENLTFNNLSLEDITSEIIIYGNENAEGTVRDYLTSIIIPYPYLESSAVREAINKICTLAQLNLIQKDNGDIRFVLSRPKKTSTDNVIKITPTQYFTEPQKDIVLKNKYKGLKTQLNNVEISEHQKVYDISIQVYNDNGEFVLKDYVNANPEFKNLGLGTIGTSPSATTGEMGVVISSNYLEIPVNNLVPKSIDDNVFAKINKTYIGGSSEEYIILGGNIESNNPTKEVLSVFYDESGTKLRINFNVAVRWQSSWGGLIQKQKVQSFTLSIYAQTYNNTFTEYIIGENDKTIKSNELLQQNTNINNKKLIDLIKNNISNDYSNGIHTAKISIFCTDLYDINGIKRKDWSAGEIIQLGEIIRVDKDRQGNSLWNYANGTPMLWKVIGRKFKMAGSPIIDLDLQEIKQ